MANGINRPYYGQHQILTSQYAKLGEFVLIDGTDYEGMYHELPNGQTFTGETQSLKSIEIIKKDFNVSPDVRQYNNIRGNSIVTYTSPKLFFPIITKDDYDNGYIERFFVQKRNNPVNTVIEISYDEYTNIGTDPGNINSMAWNNVFIRWKISKLTPDILSTLNKMEVDIAEIVFPGLKKYLSNYLEFSKT